MKGWTTEEIKNKNLMAPCGKNLLPHWGMKKEALNGQVLKCERYHFSICNYPLFRGAQKLERIFIA
jgi:hypothetical protein